MAPLSELFSAFGKFSIEVQKFGDEEKARQALEARTVDKVNPGEQQPETDHRMETDDSQIVNVEEDFLIEAFGNEYLQYKSKVCRYLGRKR